MSRSEAGASERKRIVLRICRGKGCVHIKTCVLDSIMHNVRHIAVGQREPYKRSEPRGCHEGVFQVAAARERRFRENV